MLAPVWPSGSRVALVGGRCASAIFSSLIFHVAFLYFWPRSGRRVVLASSFSESVLQCSRPFWLLSGPRGPYSLLLFSLLRAAAWPFGPGIESNTLLVFLGASRGVALLSPLCSSQCSCMMLCYAFLSVLPFPTFLAMCPMKRQQSCHCFAEPIHYPALPKGAWLATGSLSSATESLDSGLGSIYFADDCDLLLATSTFVFSFSRPVPGMRLPSHLLPNILVEVWGFEAVTMLPHCWRIPSAFVQLENLSSVFLLCLFATATRHVEGSPENLLACSFVHPSSSARLFCVFFLLPPYNWQDRPLRNLQLGFDGLSQFWAQPSVRVQPGFWIVDSIPIGSIASCWAACPPWLVAYGEVYRASARVLESRLRIYHRLDISWPSGFPTCLCLNHISLNGTPRPAHQFRYFRSVAEPDCAKLSLFFMFVPAGLPDMCITNEQAHQPLCVKLIVIFHILPTSVGDLVCMGFRLSRHVLSAVLLCLAISQQGRRSLLSIAIPTRRMSPDYPFQDQWPFHIFPRHSFCWGSLLFGFVLTPFDPMSGVSPLFLHFLVCQSSLRLVCCPPVPDPLQYLDLFLSLSLVPFCAQCWHGASRCCSAFFSS